MESKEDFISNLSRISSACALKVFVTNPTFSFLSFTFWRISLAPGGAVDESSQYLYYDISLPGNDTFIATVGITMATTDKLRAFAGAAIISITLTGVEIT